MCWINGWTASSLHVPVYIPYLPEASLVTEEQRTGQSNPSSFPIGDGSLAVHEARVSLFDQRIVMSVGVGFQIRNDKYRLKVNHGLSFRWTNIKRRMEK